MLKSGIDFHPERKKKNADLLLTKANEDNLTAAGVFILNHFYPPPKYLLFKLGTKIERLKQIKLL
jgi:hypothetical protein